MAVEVAQHLQNKFLTSLVEAESELSGSVNLLSYFEAIKDILEDREVISSSQMVEPSTLIYHLSQLNYALVECRTVANKCKELNKKLLLFNKPFMVYFILRMKRRLTTLKENFRKYYTHVKLLLESEGAREREREWVRERERERELERARESERESEEFGVHVFGFDEKAKKIEGMLFGSEAGIGFLAMGIVGIAGAGKTTLVQKVLNIRRVRDEFSPIILLRMSDIIKEGEEEFTRVVSISIVTSILEKLGHAYDDIDKEEGIRLGMLLKRLNQVLWGKKYLIVLDDVWHMNDFYSDLAEASGGGHTLGDRLSHGLPKNSGGAVMVTSRITQVARGMVGDQNNLILVEQLDRETCWRIFMDSIPGHVLNKSTLEKIKDEMQDQSLGLPLAAKTLANFIPERIRIRQIQDSDSSNSGFLHQMRELLKRRRERQQERERERERERQKQRLLVKIRNNAQEIHAAFLFKETFPIPHTSP